jgi:hypothetical protein
MGEYIADGIELCSLRLGDERRAHERRRTKARFMIKVGLDNLSSYGFCEAVEVSPGGLTIVPDPVTFDAIRDFHPKKIVILTGVQTWIRHFSVSGHVSRVSPDGTVGIRIASTSSDAFLKEWFETGGPK